MPIPICGKAYITVRAPGSIPRYDVEVIDGNSDKAIYKAGQIVSIEAVPPTGKYFIEWTAESPGVAFLNEQSVRTSFVMPKKDVSISAICEYIPTVTSVSIKPEKTTVQIGTTKKFKATVDGLGNFDDSVIWELEGNSNSGTSIDQSGLLTVDGGEATGTDTITVRVKSETDSSQFAEALVSISRDPPPKPEILGVSISPQNTSVAIGHTLQLIATVVAVGDSDEAVVWTVSGNNSNETEIDSDGLLAVASDEEIGNSLTVRAISVDNNEKFAEATITVIDIPVNTEITDITISPAAAFTLERGQSRQFEATVTGEGNYEEGVSWSITGNISSGTTISNSGLLTIAANESTASLTVRVESVQDASFFKTVTVYPGYRITIVRRPTDHATYTFGSTNALYKSGEIINLNASTSPSTSTTYESHVFSSWACSAGSVANSSSAITSYTVQSTSATNITITANYRPGNAVYINTVLLDHYYPYLVNGNRRESATLGYNGCTARFDEVNHTLYIKNHTSTNGIISYTMYNVTYFSVIAEGTNTFTGQYAGIALEENSGRGLAIWGSSSGGGTINCSGSESAIRSVWGTLSIMRNITLTASRLTSGGSSGTIAIETNANVTLTRAISTLNSKNGLIHIGGTGYLGVRNSTITINLTGASNMLCYGVYGRTVLWEDAGTGRLTINNASTHSSSQAISEGPPTLHSGWSLLSGGWNQKNVVYTR